MSGPPPAKERRRRNVPARGDWVTLPADPYKGPKPDLRGLPVDGSLSAYSKTAWKHWWRSPMAHMWTEAEWPILLRLVVVTELVARATKRGETRGLSSLLGEQRQLEDRLGISEKGRRDLRWQFAGDDTDEQAASDGSSSAGTMRSRLTLVQGAG